MDCPKIQPEPKIPVISQFSLRHHATDVKERSMLDMLPFIGIPTPKYEESFISIPTPKYEEVE